jgi:N-hydroxyarylamine O-acetyltransferase
MPLDLQAYAARIEYGGEFTPTLATLCDLHLAHATHIPFENLDILLGRGIRLDLESITAKLIDARRGGYCFEQNALFAAVLEAVGFRVTRLAARVRMGATEVRPRSHMLLAVDVDRERWLADVGFGGDGLLLPVRLKADEVQPHFGWQYRVIGESGLHVLQAMRPDGWFDLYGFTLEEQHAADYEVSNYFTATHPQSPFVNKLVAQRPGKDVRLTLVNRQLTEQRPDAVLETTLADDEALLETLAERFGLRFPTGTRFAYKGEKRTWAAGITSK